MKNKQPTGPVAGRNRHFMLLLTTATVLSFGCHKSNVDHNDLRDFKQVNLVSNSEEYRPLRSLDPTLQNGFGIAWSPTGIAWVNSVLGHVSELYDAEGFIKRKPVNIPSAGDTIGGFPCGIVFSGGKGFNLPNGGGPSVFLFTSFDGVLSGWNPAAGDNAKRIKAPPGASYTGLAIADSKGQTFIYGANFGQKKIDVWDTAFNLVKMPFKDAAYPAIPADYSPYNIQAVGNYLFVVYAKLGSDGHGVEGKGNGFVSIFNPDGSFVGRLASRGTLDIPWGVTLAPSSFLEDKDMDKSGEGEGDYQNDAHHKSDIKDPVILVGNFGDGRINVYSQEGKFLGQLQSHKHTIEIEGLWALSFPPASAGIDPGRLYFSAGPDKEADGIFGYLIKE